MGLGARRSAIATWGTQLQERGWGAFLLAESRDSAFCGGLQACRGTPTQQGTSRQPLPWSPPHSACRRAWMLRSRSAGLHAISRSDRKTGRPAVLGTWGTFRTRKQSTQEFFWNKTFNSSFRIWVLLTFHRHLHSLSRYLCVTGDWKACFVFKFKDYSLSVTHNFATLGTTSLKNIQDFIFSWPVLVTWETHFSNALVTCLNPSNFWIPVKIF